jgi:hypothetical protein
VTDVNLAVPVKPGQRVAVVVLGVLTLLWAAGHEALGTYFIVGLRPKTVLRQEPTKDRVQQVGQAVLASAQTLAFSLAAAEWATILVPTGAYLLLVSVLGLLAGLGLLLRKQWGRLLSFALVPLVLLLGLLFLVGASRLEAGKGLLFFLLGTAEFLQGIATLSVGMTTGAAFARLGSEQPQEP